MNEVDPICGRLDATDGVRGLTPSYALANFFVRFAAMRPSPRRRSGARTDSGNLDSGSCPGHQSGAGRNDERETGQEISRMLCLLLPRNDNFHRARPDADPREAFCILILGSAKASLADK
jgi:hypothetical protein